MRSALLALALAACATVKTEDTYLAEACDAQVHGACVVYEAGARRLTEARMEGMFQAAAAHWETTVDAIAGYTVVVKARNPYPFGDSWIWGVTIPEMKRLDFATPVARCPEIVFVHEWGHATGILHHMDTRFSADAIRATLLKREVPGCKT